ncbi:hypothetical protein N869_05105 [Cellulomonas bogoriensis 69B4 = DSM 16987]|uniref:Uncharacterized protein n=1 Tax=Cellulomonas bogoriensis 69B4 = DSM 16987 TaxID=1386082 RepID=A0A0A0C1P9_9CELL|nr:hypothetical protein [Cellulomonas bogoriensis]KGM14588.1 hypothetical protein N869_05105 [Cellulomonas bogoriensis 69B4 = DSM 16987]
MHLDRQPSTWDAWIGTAADVDEHALRARLVRSAPDAWKGYRERALEESLSLLLAGEALAARGVLLALGAEQARGAPGTGPAGLETVLGAALDATDGDDDAYAWLVDHEERHALQDPRLTRLLAVVADSRDETEVADRAWSEVMAQAVRLDPARARRAVVALVSRRERDGLIGPMVADLLSCVALVRSTQVEDWDQVAVDAAHDLRARGDVAGARLLLRAFRAAAPPTAPVDRARRALTPAAVSVRAVANAVVFTVLAAGALALAVRWGNPLPLFALAVLAVAGARVVHVPGMTEQEGNVWQRLGAVELDPRRGIVETGAGLAWFAVLGVAGALSGLTATSAATSQLREAGRHGAWLDGGGGLALWFVGMLAGAVAAVLMGRWLHTAVRRHETARRWAAADREGVSPGAACRCWQVSALVDERALGYAGEHLLPLDRHRGVGDPLDRGDDLWQCPESDTLWLLTGPGGSGRTVALRGTAVG